MLAIVPAVAIHELVIVAGKLQRTGHLRIRAELVIIGRMRKGLAS